MSGIEQPGDPLPAAAAALARGRTIETVRIVRDAEGVDLRRAPGSHRAVRVGRDVPTRGGGRRC